MDFMVTYSSMKPTHMESGEFIGLIKFHGFQQYSYIVICPTDSVVKNHKNTLTIHCHRLVVHNNIHYPKSNADLTNTAKYLSNKFYQL